MTLYDSTSKTKRRVPEESEKKGGTGDTAIKDLEIETSNCDNKLAILQREIEDIKHKASIVKGQLDLILVPNSKLDQLLKSIHQLRMPHKDDFCHVPGLDTYLEAARRYISVGLLSVETHLKDLSGIMSQPYVSTCLVGLITLLCLYVGIAVKWQQAQPGHRDGHGDNEAIDLQNDDGQQENQEGDGCNLEPEGHGQNPLPLTEDLAPEQADERNPSEAPAQVPDATEDECCDENHSITKTPITETRPETKHYVK
ncbi:hypothetical protein AAFF_G00204460 [Aldrovandia affinis]|uniref:Uncharacterized protein n=1 Tax=Aldrovandia affinis TaxID=143900 RepID=A0AAD7RKQ4_9TELE|nr:hypothetical protein AAFF_G00204460 [Aldrovandia affinis]